MKKKKFCVYWSILSDDGNEWPNQMVVEALSKSKARSSIEQMIIPDNKFRITKVELV